MIAPVYPGAAAPARPSRTPGWDPLLAAAAALLALTVGRLHLAIPGLDVVRPVLILGILAVGLYLLDMTRPRRLHTIWRGPTPWLVALLIWMFVGLPTSIRGFRSLEFIFNDFVKTALVFMVIAGCVRAFRDVERLAWTYFAAAVAYAVVVITRFQVGDGSWRLGDMITYDANDFAVLAVTALPIGLYSAFRPGRSALGRAFDWTGMVLLAITFVWAGSRGGFLALLATVGFLLVRYRAMSTGTKISAVVGIAVVVVVVAGPAFWQQMSTMLAPSTDYNITSETGRLQVWKRGIGYVKDRPFFGVGASNFPVAEGVLSPLAGRSAYGLGVRWSAAHNAYLEVAAELGVPGLLLFLGLLTSTLLMLVRLERVTEGMEGARRPRFRGLSEALMASLVGFLVAAIFLSLAYSVMLYVLAALSVGLDKAARLTAPAVMSAGAAGVRPTVPSTAWNLNSSMS